MRIFVLLLFITQLLTAQKIEFEKCLDEDGKQQVYLSEAHIEVDIGEILTEVSIQLTLYNTSWTQKSSTVFIQLPDSAKISGFYLDIHGKLREASTIEKNRARIAFESEMRRRIDPGLVEWNQGNLYKTRVYPINRNSDRTIKLTYIIESKEVLTIPLEFFKPDKFSFAVKSVKSSVISPSFKSEVLTNKSGTYSYIKSQKENINGAVKIQAHKPSNLNVEKNIDGNYYWIYKKKLLGSSVKRYNEIHELNIFQDISLSRRKADRDKELALLKEIAKNLNIQKIKLYQFNHNCKFVKAFSTVEEMEKAYLTAIHDGGTIYSKLHPSLNSKNKVLNIVISDGFDNFSGFSTKHNAIAINSSERFDKYALKRMNSTVVNLHTTEIETALKKILFNKPEVITDSPEVYSEVKADNTIIVTGILKEGQSSNFQLSEDDKLKKVTISTKESILSDKVRKYWAGQKCDCPY